MDHCLLRVHFDLIQTKIDAILAILSVGIEPTTLGLLDPRSNQLSYESLILNNSRSLFKTIISLLVV